MTGRVVPLDLPQRRAILIAGDVAVLAILTLLSLRLGAIRSGWVWSVAFVWGHLLWFVVLGGLWVLLAAANGLYDPRRAPDRYAAAVLSAKVSLQILVIWAVFYFVPPPWTLVRHVVVFFAAGAAIAMPLWRLTYATVFSQPAFRRRVLIVGAGESGRALLTAIRQEAPHAFDVVGFADDDPAKAATVVDGVPVVADRVTLVPTAERLGVTELALAVTHGIHSDLFAALMDAREQGLTVSPMPLLYEAVTGRVPVEHIGEHWAVALPLDPPESRGLYRLVRRGFDLAFGLLGLALLGVLLLVVAPILKLTSPGPVFYRQDRVGLGGRRFQLIKLRTMVAQAEPDGPVWTAVGDPRVTAFGRWLRRTKLDELPQVINVLRGDMCVVGPRPERPEFVSDLAAHIPFYKARHAVRPGLTGWASVRQGYSSSTKDALLKLQYDLYYIKHQSPYLDALILLRTAVTVLRFSGR